MKQIKRINQRPLRTIPPVQGLISLSLYPRDPHIPPNPRPRGFSYSRDDPSRQESASWSNRLEPRKNLVPQLARLEHLRIRPVLKNVAHSPLSIRQRMLDSQ